MKRREHVDKGEKSMRVKETLLLAAWNNAIGTNSIKANINRTEKSSKFRRDETINYIRGECFNLDQKQNDKNKNVWAGVLIYWKLRKRLGFEDIHKI